MLRVFEKKRGVFQEASLSKLSSKSFTWVECIAPSKTEISVLSKILKVSEERMGHYLFPDLRPHVLPGKDLSIITLSVLVGNKSAVRQAPITMFVVNSNNIITLRSKEGPVIEVLEKIMKDNPKTIQSASSFLFELVDEINDNTYAILDKLEDQLDYLEDASFHHPSREIMRKNIDLKKNLLRIHKTLTADREVLLSIERGMVPQLKNTQRFRFLYNDLVQLIEMSDTYREVLTGVIEIYLSSISNSLNNIVKKLTVVGSLVLFPTLIASIYGMNFQKTSLVNMPELYWAYGYPFSLSLMVLSVIGLYIFFKRKKWI
ncbi:MAG: magnesium/cobalt transporter CorA [Nanoarchaeota archaeon]|nr:magnesium/cobalt transporter CorA [Nanoarchaeota archaeon]